MLSVTFLTILDPVIRSSILSDYSKLTKDKTLTGSLRGKNRNTVVTHKHKLINNFAYLCNLSFLHFYVRCA